MSAALSGGVAPVRQRFGAILKRFGHEVDEDTFAWNTRAALDYHRQVLEHIANIAKKL